MSNAADLAKKLAPLGVACAAVDRGPGTVETSRMWDMQGGLDAIKMFEDAGASRLIVPLQALGNDPGAGITQPGENIIAKC